MAKIRLPLHVHRAVSQRSPSNKQTSKPESTSASRLAFPVRSRKSFRSTKSTRTTRMSLSPNTSVAHNLARAGLLLEGEELPKRRSISKATISASQSGDIHHPADQGVASTSSLHLPTRPKANPLHAPKLSSESPARTGSVPPERTANNIRPTTGSISIVSIRAPATPASGRSTPAGAKKPGYNGSATASPSTIRSSLPVSFNPSLPAYVLDRIHPCIPLPPPWDYQHDQYIVSLDIQDYHLPAIVRRVKQRFPELRSECITPGMIDRRLRILDLRVEWLGWKEAMGSIDTELDECDDEADDCAVSPGSPNKPNARKVITVAGNKFNHHRRISTGGLSGKITINKHGTSVVTVGGPRVSNTVGGSVRSSSPLNRDHSSSVSPRTISATGAAPSSSSVAVTKTLNVPEKAAEQLKMGDFAAHIESILKMDPMGSSIVKAEGQGEDQICGKGERESIGVPSVMRTSSGRPVLR